jgi:hypothetical protein
MKRAQEKGDAWCEIGGGLAVPVVATAWPVDVLDAFLEDVEARRFRITRSDDAAVSKFVHYRNVKVRAPVPSIVEHPDGVPSLIGDRAANGTNSSRMAAVLGDVD